MKKILLMFVLSGFMLTSCKDNNSGDVSSTEKTELSEFDKLEGKVVKAPNSEWYVIKDGLKWVALSEAATTDYLNSLKTGENNVINNVDAKLLEQFPYAGEILPKIVFKKDEKLIAK